MLKPSERDPAPPCSSPSCAGSRPAQGVLNVVNGDKEAVDALLEARDVKAVELLSAPTPIAEYIYTEANARQARAGPGRRQEPRRGHARTPTCDNTVNALMGAAYGSCGERCMAISVVVAVGDDVADAVVDEPDDRDRQDLKVGPGTDSSNDMGPLVTEPALREGQGLRRQRRRSRAPSWWWMAVAVEVAGNEERLLPRRPACSTTSSPAWRSTRKKSFGPVLGVVRVEACKRPCS